MNKQRLMQSLSRMTVANGCTEAEAKTAREKLTKMRDAERAKRDTVSEQMERYKRWIDAQERARKTMESRRVFAQWQQNLRSDWDDLGYDKGDVDYREFKKKELVGRIMPISNYFNTYENNSEQTVLDDLIVESINIYGQNMYYIPRTLKTPDPLYGESPITEFNSAYMFPVYIENVDGFTGEGNFLSRFGLEVRDQVVFTTAMKSFQDDVASESQDIVLPRPREGDLIYWPLRKAAFQILFVDKYQMYFPLGSLHTWKMTCELFEYSSERFNTGIEDIDSLEQKYSADLLQWAVYNEDGDYMITEDGDIWVDEAYKRTSPEPWTDSDVIQQEANVSVQQANADWGSFGKV